MIKELFMSMNKNDIAENPITELVDSEGSPISGDRNATSDSEIETGPVQKPFNDDSDYEKGMSTTTDRATRYAQNIPWFAVYSYGQTAGPIARVNETKKKLTKKQLEEDIKEDLVKKSTRDRDVMSKEEKAEKLIDKIGDAIDAVELTPDQLEKIKTAVMNKLSKADA
jgi:hypothetical protein